MNSVEIVITIIMIILIVFYIQNQNFEVEYVISNVDGNRYLVKNLPDKKKAADMLAKLNISLQKLITEMERQHPEDEAVKRLKSNYRPANISEGSEKHTYTSYSINKGEKIVFCLRARDGSNKLVPFNVLKYVAIHELAHLMTRDIGHPKVFWDNFKRLLLVAVEIGVYKKTNYAESPAKYCGLTIKSSVI
jgi:hypothetical protein